MRFTSAALACLTVVALFPATGKADQQAFPDVTTGSRTWSMADGSTRKLRFVEFGKKPEIVTFQWGAAPGGMLLADFSAESRAFLDAIRDGRIKLLKTPGLSAQADFPAGPVRRDPVFYQRVGVLREWTRLDGRKVQASMINLNDEVVSVMIGEKVWNLPTSDLSDTDLRYLDEVKAGRERTVPLIVPLTGNPWGGAAALEISANGHQVIGEPANDHRFEDALARVIAMVRTKLDKSCWEFHELSELEVTKPPAGNGWELLAPADPAEFPSHRTSAARRDFWRGCGWRALRCGAPDPVCGAGGDISCHNADARPQD